MAVLFFCISARIVIDLFGESASGTLAPGGVFALLVLAATALFAPLQPKFRSAIINAPMGFVLLSSALLGVVSLSALIDASIGARVAPMTKVLSGGVVFIFLALAPATQKPRQLYATFYWAFLVCLLVPIVIAILQQVHLVPFSYYDAFGGHWVGRPSGGYRQPNSFGRLLVFAIVFTYLARDYGVIRSPAKYALVLAFLLLTIMSTHRSSLLIAICCTCALEARSTSRALTSALIVTSTSAAALVAIPSLGTKLASMRTIQVLMLVFRDGHISFRGRENLAARALELFNDVGPTARLFGLGYEPFIIDNGNLYLLLSQGLIGGLLLLSAYAAAVVSALQRTARHRVYIFSVASIFLAYQLIMYAHTASHLLWMMGAATYFAKIAPSSLTDVTLRNAAKDR